MEAAPGLEPGVKGHFRSNYKDLRFGKPGANRHPGSSVAELELAILIKSGHPPLESVHLFERMTPSFGDIYRIPPTA
jgi:hypothetical protein